MAQKGILLVISGPSGAGKGTLCKELLNQVPGLNYSVSATTRAPRAGEENGVNYFFYSRPEFEELIAQEEFLEWAQVYNNLYGTPRSYVDNMLRQNKDVILEIDIQGARQVKQRFPQGVFVFVVPPDLNELARRLRERKTDTEEEINKRLGLAEEEMEYAKEYDYIVVNDDLTKAVNDLKAIIEKEKRGGVKDGLRNRAG